MAYIFLFTWTKCGLRVCLYARVRCPSPPLQYRCIFIRTDEMPHRDRVTSKIIYNNTIRIIGGLNDIGAFRCRFGCKVLVRWEAITYGLAVWSCCLSLSLRLHFKLLMVRRNCVCVCLLVDLGFGIGGSHQATELWVEFGRVCTVWWRWRTVCETKQALRDGCFV